MKWIILAILILAVLAIGIALWWLSGGFNGSGKPNDPLDGSFGKGFGSWYSGKGK